MQFDDPPTNEFFRSIDQAAEQKRTPKANGQEPPNPIWIDDDAWEESDIPLRPWVSPGYALRGAVTLIVGPPSAMKSSLMLAWACSEALGKAHGNFCPKEASTVIIYNVEDDKDEQRRRLSAVLQQFNAVPTDIKGKVIRVGPTGIGYLFDRDDKGKLIPTLALVRLREIIKERQPSMLIADPFAELHPCDENDNTALRAVVAEFRSLAVEFGIAVILVHYTRKGVIVPGDPDGSRGASSTVGASRIVLTLITMREEDAEGFGMPKDRKNRANYVRLDDGRQNYAAIGDAQWFEKKVYRLGTGEFVPAAVPWDPPDLFEGVTIYQARTILDEIDAGLPDGDRYSDANSAKEKAAWQVVTKYAPSTDKTRAIRIVNKWVKDGPLLKKDYVNSNGDKAKGLWLDATRRPG